MLKEYRKKTTIKAEQFDGSEEMIKKYSIDFIPDFGNEDFCYFLDATYANNMIIKIGDYIVTDINDERYAISADDFNKTYEEIK
ncbi:hypothetical protein R4B61_00420 [Fructilactobacillus vespulae]|uniref:hypothetical protein n=1 Tax=Fructilactobacillus vespulae TaxID=1249630 RepID=UPI0039B55DB6